MDSSIPFGTALTPVFENKLLGIRVKVSPKLEYGAKGVERKLLLSGERYTTTYTIQWPMLKVISRWCHIKVLQ